MMEGAGEVVRSEAAVCLALPGQTRLFKLIIEALSVRFQVEWFPG